MHLVEEPVGDVARVDTAAEPPHQAWAGRLPEDGGADRVDADHPQLRPAPAQRFDQPGAVAPGADTAHQDVEVVEVTDEFPGHRVVTGRIVRVVVLIRPVRVRPSDQHLAQSGQPGRLPAALGRRVLHQFQPGTVGAEQLPHGRFEFRVADQDHRVPEGLSREGQADAERAGGGLHHRGAGAQFAARVGAAEHRHGRTRLHAARTEAFEFRPEAGMRVRERDADPGQRGAAEQRQQVRVGLRRGGVGGLWRGQQGWGRHRAPSWRWTPAGPP